MEIKRVFTVEMTEEEKEILEKAIEVLDNRGAIQYWKSNAGSKLTDRVEDTIQLLKDITAGKMF